MLTKRSRGRPPHPDVLTPAEWQVLQWVRHGLSKRQIAQMRGTSVAAVRFHIANISGKLDVAGVRDLRRWPGLSSTTASRGQPSRPTVRREAPMPTDPSLRLGPVGQVSLLIRDVARAEGFYGETLGLAHLFTFGDLVFFDLAGTRLYLHRKDDPEWRPGSILYFTVEDIGAAYDELGRRGVRLTGAPHRIHVDEVTGVEEWMAFFLDSEGNTLALMSRVVPGTAT